jgi:hypothetical protein
MIVAFAGPMSVGQTFLEWSFHYLQDHKIYWNHQLGDIPLSDDPITKKNAHGHLKNHPSGMASIKQFVTDAGKQERDDITFYPFIDPIDDPDLLDHYRTLASYLRSQAIKQVWLKPIRPYPYFYERTDLRPESILRRIKNTWLNQQTDDIVAIRQEISLRLHKNRLEWLEQVDDLFLDVDKLADRTFTDTEWQSDPETCLRNIFDSFDLAVHEGKIESWRRIASVWQENIGKMVQFYEQDIPKIAEKIIHNEDFDITPYHMDYLRQAVLMSYIMRIFGRRLMIMTEEFPKNTKDLHQLLK